MSWAIDCVQIFQGWVGWDAGDGVYADMNMRTWRDTFDCFHFRMYEPKEGWKSKDAILVNGTTGRKIHDQSWVQPGLTPDSCRFPDQ